MHQQCIIGCRHLEVCCMDTDGPINCKLGIKSQYQVVLVIWKLDIDAHEHVEIIVANQGELSNF